jgi:hypothetical protein
MNTLDAAVEAFSGAIESAHGEMKNRIVKPRGAYCRAVLPLKEEVKRRDMLHHGAALRMHPRQLEVVPFVFRQVCSNGAIWSHNADAFSLQITDATAEGEIVEFVESSTASAASAETFQSCLAEIRAGITRRIDIGLVVTSMFRSRGAEMDDTALMLVLAEMLNQPEASTRYDAMNIVTAAAREVPDPELKWRMESLATRLLTGAEVERKALPAVREREFAEV